MRKKCGCGMRRVLRTWRRRTAYVQNDLNFMLSCYECIQEDDETKHGDWASYYSSQYGYYQQSEYIKRKRKEYVE